MIVASETTVTDIYGIGPLMAAIIIGRVGDIRRFPTAGHFARHNGTAPIEASSGPKKRHRFQLNHAIHMAAVTQISCQQPRHPWPRLLRAQTGRGQDWQRSDAGVETTHQRRRLPTTHRRRPPLTAANARAPARAGTGGSGRTTRGRH